MSYLFKVKEDLINEQTTYTVIVRKKGIAANEEFVRCVCLTKKACDDFIAQVKQGKVL